jgi:hypothetical protein
MTSKIGTWFRSNGPVAPKQYRKQKFYSGRCCRCENWLTETWLLKLSTGEKQFYCDDCASKSAITQQTITEHILALSNATFIVPKPEWRSSGTTDDLSTSYGDWDELRQGTANLEAENIDPSKTYVMPDYTSGSDYSGDLVNVSNHKAIIAMMPETYTDGIEYLDYSGGHGTFALAIRFDAVTEELIEAMESLEDYPVLDDSLHSELEMESQNEAWESTYRSDFKTALGKALFQEWVDSPATDQKDNESDDDFSARQDAVETFLSDDCGDMSNEVIDELFYKLSDRANVYWVNEQGSDSYIDVDDVVKRGLAVDKRSQNDSLAVYHAQSLAEVRKLIQNGMSDTKYDLGIVRWVNPDQLSFDFNGSVAA